MKKGLKVMKPFVAVLLDGRMRGQGLKKELILIEELSTNECHNDKFFLSLLERKRRERSKKVGTTASACPQGKEV